MESEVFITWKGGKSMTENLFAEPNLKQITVWARGVLQNKDARCCRCTDRGQLQGRAHVQAWENYGPA